VFYESCNFNYFVCAEFVHTVVISKLLFTESQSMQYTKPCFDCSEFTTQAHEAIHLIFNCMVWSVTTLKSKDETFHTILLPCLSCNVDQLLYRIG